MDSGAVTGLGNVPAVVGDGVTGNFTAAGNRFAAAGAPAGAAEPVPRISGQPQTVSAAPPWTAPQPGGGGRITVARDVLRGVADRMRSELATFDSAMSRTRAAGPASAPWRAGRPATPSAATRSTLMTAA